MKHSSSIKWRRVEMATRLGELGTAMRPAIGFGILVVSAAMFVQPALGGEGRVSDATPTLEKGRIANYTRTAPEPTTGAKSGKTHTNTKAARAKSAQAKSIRPAAAQAVSSRAD